MSEIIAVTATILIDTDDIKDVKGLFYEGPDSELDGKFLIRVITKTPFTDILCKDLATAKETYRNISKSRRVVSIAEMRYKNERST